MLVSIISILERNGEKKKVKWSLFRYIFKNILCSKINKNQPEKNLRGR